MPRVKLANGALRDALVISERARARMTIELLNEGAVELHQGLDGDLSRKKQKFSRVTRCLDMFQRFYWRIYCR